MLPRQILKQQLVPSQSFECLVPFAYFLLGFLRCLLLLARLSLSAIFFSIYFFILEEMMERFKTLGTDS